MKEPDGSEVIDRDPESQLFGTLLECRDQRQLLLISDRKQRGKTTLLRKLKFQCDWGSPRVPCALVRLDDLPDSHPYALVEELYQGLRATNVPFPGFQRQREAIHLRDATAFATRGAASFEGATISGHAQAAAVIANVHVAAGSGPVSVHAATPAWDATLETYARESAIDRFFEDLRAACETTTVACLIDSVDEQANRTLISWVLERFVRAELLDHPKPPRRLVLALAGRRDKAPFTPFRQKYPHRVESVEMLGEWTAEHVRAFLELNRPDDIPAWPLTDVDIEYLRAKINSGDSLEMVLSVVMAITRAKA